MLGINLNSKLIEACRNNNLEMVKYLVKKGADIHVNNEWPLKIACEYNNLEIVKYLVEQEADFKIVNHKIFKRAFKRKQIDVVNCLIECYGNDFPDELIEFMII